jgi:hypothetical protein
MAMVCMVNSTAYTTNIHDNNSLLIETSKNPKCQHVKNPDVVKDLGYHVSLFVYLKKLLRVPIYGIHKCKVHFFLQLLMEVSSRYCFLDIFAIFMDLDIYAWVL